MSEDDLLWPGWFIASSRLCEESYKVTDTLRFHCVVLSGSSKAILTSPTNKLWKPEAPSMVSAVALASFPPALRLVHWWLHYTAWLPQNCNMNEGTGFTRVPRKLVNWNQTWFDTLNKWCPHAGPRPWRHQHQHYWMEKSGRRDVLRLVKITTHPSFPHGVCPSLVPSPGHLFFLTFFLGHIACDFW